MSIPRRKIGFYFLQFREFGVDENFLNVSEMDNIIDYIINLPKQERIYTITASNKFHLLSDVARSGNIIKGIFKSAKYLHCPDLINRTNAVERPSPKDPDEGESELTHFSMKIKTKYVDLILEERKVGIAIGQIANYFNRYAGKYNPSKNYDIVYSIVPKKDFYNELRRLRRVYIVRFYTDKSMLADDYLKFTERTEEVKEDIEIEIKARRNFDIKNIVLDNYDRESGITKNEIHKIRVIGKNEDGNQVILDTDVMRKIENVEVDINEETGIVNSNILLNALADLLPE